MTFSRKRYKPCLASIARLRRSQRPIPILKYNNISISIPPLSRYYNSHLDSSLHPQPINASANASSEHLNEKIVSRVHQSVSQSVSPSASTMNSQIPRGLRSQFHFGIKKAPMIKRTRNNERISASAHISQPPHIERLI